ncbi:hypothetical protein EMIT0P176_80079 [Pseudomonas sp. IT-P176]
MGIGHRVGEFLMAHRSQVQYRLKQKAHELEFQCSGAAEVSVTDEGGAADVLILTHESLSRTISCPGLSQRSVSSNPGRTIAPLT